MKSLGRIVLISTPLFAILLTAQTISAYTTSNIKVVTEGDGEAHVNIVSTNDSTSTSTTKSSNTGRTDIVIECNGVKKEYHSDKAENVTLTCDDSTSGTVKSEVKITSDTSPTSKVTPNPTIEEGEKKIKEEMEKKKSEIKAEVKSARDKIKEQRKDLFEQMTQMIREFFQSFHF